VFRWALASLFAVLGTLVVLATLPDRRADAPDASIRLFDARLVLYPEADPDAVWTFAVPEAAYDPVAETTTLFDLREGARRVGDEVDFTLQGAEVIIDRNDDLRGDQLRAVLQADGLQLDMEARAGRQVVIDQRAGRFEVPRASITGDGLDGVYEDMRIAFDFTEFEAGGPGTVGYATFEAERGRSE
jgi:hypothetical protein